MPAPSGYENRPSAAELELPSADTAKAGGVFFEGFHELRAVAALAVIVHHLELFKFREHLPSLIQGPGAGSLVSTFFIHLGKSGVFLFFVLSGFLITYLLLLERERFGRIDIRNFYIRRVLRIWPLYYLIMALAFLSIPHWPEWFPFVRHVSSYMARIDALPGYAALALPYYLLFLINLSVHPPVAGAAQAWSVSVEEQFYVFWPWLFRFLYRYLPWVFAAIIVVVQLANYRLPGVINTHALRTFVYYTRFDLMAMGGLLAWGLYHRRPWLVQVLSSRWSVWIGVAGAIALLCTRIWQLPMGLCFGLIISYVALNGRRIRGLAFLRHAGEISYGLYMFHPAVLFLALGLMMDLAADHAGQAWFHMALYALTIGGTWGVSWLSYRFLEKPFLRLKKVFERVKTGKEAP